MAGTAKPIEARREAKYNFIGGNLHGSVPITTPPKFLDGIENATFPNVLYLNNNSQYVEIELHEKCNIWRHTATGGEVRHRNPLIIKKLMDGNYVDVTSTVEQHEIEANTIKWTKFISKIPSGTYRFYLNLNPPPATGTIGYTSVRSDSEWFIEGLEINKTLILSKNEYVTYNSEWQTVSSSTPSESQYLSDGMDDLSVLERKVQPLSPIKMNKSEILLINNGGRYFSKTINLKRYLDIRNLTTDITGQIKLCNVGDYENLIDFTSINDIYNNFIDEVEVILVPNGSETEANLILEANWSPLDELDGDFEIVTWTDETDATRQLELTGTPSPQFIYENTIRELKGNLSNIITNDLSTYATSSNVRFLLTNNNSTWYKWNGLNFETVNHTTVDEILNSGNTYDELTNADYSKWTHSKINIGVFLMDDNNTTSKISELGIVENSPVNTSQVSNLNFYILNTTAKIDLDLKGLWLSGHLSDLDLTRVQYRVFLNNQPYFPQSGEFTNLADPPLNIDITFRSDEIKINDWNTLRVEFKDYFGTMDYWQTTFVGNYSSLMFMDTDGNYYSDDVGKVLQYLDFGTFFGGQYSLEHEVVVKNQYGYDVKNVMIEANTGHLPEGVAVQFSDTIDPFIPQNNLILPNELKDNEQVSFYIRMISDIDSVPNGENKFDIFVKAERKV